MRPLAVRPCIVVRAFIDPALMDEFAHWYREVHLPHVREIPGVVSAFRARGYRRNVNWMAIYALSDDSQVQGTLTSAEAERARQDWERWLPVINEFSIEVYAGLGPIPIYQHFN